MTLKISISGIRGITGKTLTDDVVSNFSKAFATYLKSGTVVIGRDSRASGEKLKDIVIADLKLLGINVIYLGIAPTPTVQFMTRKLNANGGMVITASHNPSEWNGLKFIRSDGIFLNETEAGRLIHIYNKGQFKAEEKAGNIRRIDDPYYPHIKKVLEQIDIKRIKSKRFKVVLDSCNGAGSIISIKLLNELGCEVVNLYTDPNKPFPRNPEPIPENLNDLCVKVKETGANIGFAQDADADRLAIVTEKGTAPGEEYTLALAVEHMLNKSKVQDPRSQIVVTNLSTSMMIDKIAEKYGAKVIRTKIGEVNVAEEMVRQKALIGGEGNGGVIFPNVGLCRDSLIAIGLILDALAGSNKNISQIIEGLPRFEIVKRKMDCSSKPEADSFIKRTFDKFKSEKLDLTEGVKILYKDAWVHVRASNTEPIIRIIAEAKDKYEAEKLINQVLS